MSESELVLMQRHGAVAVVTFNDPERMNPFSDRMRTEALTLVDAAMQDRDIRVIVLTGAGGQFSAGADVRQMVLGETPDPLRSRQRLITLQTLIRLIVGGAKPVVAAVEGVAFGAGLSVATACDFVVASEAARFGAAFGKIGLAADCGLLWTLPQRVGPVRAKDMIFTGKPVNGTEAHALGLVDRLVAPGTALEAALEKAQDYLGTAPLTISTVKAALEEGPKDLEHALRIEQHQQPMMSMTADHAEGRLAFLEKRKPNFTGL